MNNLSSKLHFLGFFFWKNQKSWADRPISTSPSSTHKKILNFLWTYPTINPQLLLEIRNSFACRSYLALKIPCSIFFDFWNLCPHIFGHITPPPYKEYPEFSGLFLNFSNFFRTPLFWNCVPKYLGPITQPHLPRIIRGFSLIFRFFLELHLLQLFGPIFGTPSIFRIRLTIRDFLAFFFWIFSIFGNWFPNTN